MKIRAINKNNTFCGKYKTTNNGNPYYNTNVGCIVGTSGCALLTCAVGVLNHKKPKYALYTMLATAPLIVMGVISDKIRNNKNKKAADMIAKYGVNEVMDVDNDIKISDKNHMYKKCYSGAIVGGILSVATAIGLLTFLTKKSMNSGKAIKAALKDALKEIFDETLAVDGMLAGPFVPLTIGAGIDVISNFEAQKYA